MSTRIINAGQEIQGIPLDSVTTKDESMPFLILLACTLLRFNARTEDIKRQIDRVAKHLGIEVMTLVAYRDVTLVAPDGRHFHAQIHQHLLNSSLLTEVVTTIDSVCSDSIGIDEATRRIESAISAPPKVGAVPLGIIYVIGGAALAWLLQADVGTIIVSSVSSLLGFLARRALAGWHGVLFVPSFIATLIGAVLAGIVFLLGWTKTPGLCLMIPALILVPGVHLINGVTEMLENNVQMGFARLGLSAGIILATVLGILIGSWITLGMLPSAATPSESAHLSLLTGVVLAGVMSCCISVIFNSPWRVVGMSTLCGIIGYGLRSLCIGAGVGFAVATFIACLAIGLLGEVIARRIRAPFATLAFASAFVMMPGLLVYESMVTAVKLAAPLGTVADPVLAAGMLSLLSESAIVLGAMAVGLLGGARLARLVQALFGQ